MFQGEGLVQKNQSYLSIYKSLKWHQGYFKWMLTKELYSISKTVNSNDSTN